MYVFAMCHQTQQNKKILVVGGDPRMGGDQGGAKHSFKKKGVKLTLSNVPPSVSEWFIKTVGLKIVP